MSAADQLLALARVGVSLVVVLLLAVVVARLARRGGLRGPGAGLRVLDRVGLSREASLAVVEVGGRALLLGVTAHEVTMLGELDPELVVPPSSPGPVPRKVVGPGLEETAAPVTTRTVQDGPATGTVQDGPATARTVGTAQGPASTARTRGVRVARAGGGTGATRGSVLSPRTWRQAVEALRELTARRG